MQEAGFVLSLSIKSPRSGPFFSSFYEINNRNDKELEERSDDHYLLHKRRISQ